MAGFLEQVKKTIEKYNMLELGDKIIVGVSGGPDSIALLAILNLLKEQYNLKLWVVHVNHMFRGEEAKREAEFVVSLAEKWELPCQVFEENVPALIAKEGLSPQEAGHRVRKQIYNEVKLKIGANKLALGHHADDRAETVLLHLIQGTGLDGLAAMPPKHGWLIRPLSQVSKKSIITYCQNNDLPYCLDPSNTKTVYLRNKIRHNLIPYLIKEFNPQMVDNLLKLEDIVIEENDYLEKQVQKLLKNSLKEKKQGQLTLDLSQFNHFHPAVQRRIIRKVYKLLRPEEQNLAYVNVEQIINICQEQRGAKQIRLPKDILAKKSYTTLDFFDLNIYKIVKPLANDFCYEWDIPGILNLPLQKITLNAYYTKKIPQKTKGFTQIVVDGSLIKTPLQVRNRKAGDRIQPLGMQGTKKLKDLFIEKKIAREKRDLIPIICSHDDIIWLPGLTMSEKFKINPQTNCFLVLEMVIGEYV